MHVPDLINAGFEFFGGLTSWLNSVRLYRDKKIHGVDPRVWFMFTAWGVWNLYYYPSLGQYISFYAGTLIVFSNLTWLGLWYKYRRNV